MMILAPDYVLWETPFDVEARLFRSVTIQSMNYIPNYRLNSKERARLTNGSRRHYLTLYSPVGPFSPWWAGVRAVASDNTKFSVRNSHEVFAFDTIDWM